MKYFMVEGTIIDVSKMSDDIMIEHQAYTQEAMVKGDYFLSGLKEDMSGGIFLMKANSLSDLKRYLNEEPFYVAGIQTYRMIEFNYHYVNDQLSQWFCD